LRLSCRQKSNANLPQEVGGFKGSAAMAAGLSDKFWSTRNLAEMIDASLPKPGKLANVLQPESTFAAWCPKRLDLVTAHLARTS
jgi:hypothetical protein